MDPKSEPNGPQSEPKGPKWCQIVQKGHQLWAKLEPKGPQMVPKDTNNLKDSGKPSYKGSAMVEEWNQTAWQIPSIL